MNMMKTRRHAREYGPAPEDHRWITRTAGDGLEAALLDVDVWVEYPGSIRPIAIRKLEQGETRELVGIQRWQPRLVIDGLSFTEYRIFMELAAGKGVSQIAAEFFLSVKTVSTYRARIVEKTNLSSNAHIAVYAYRYKLITWPMAPVPSTPRGKYSTAKNTSLTARPPAHSGGKPDPASAHEVSGFSTGGSTR